MTIRPSLASDAAAIESLFREFVIYLRSIGDEHDYRFSAQQYLADGFGSDPFPVRHPPAEYSGAKRHRNGRVDEVFDILHHA